MNRVRAWIGRKFARKPKKTPEQKARDKVIKHCQESKAFKIKDHYGDTKLCFNIDWYHKAKALAWKNPDSARYIIGTMQNAKKRGLIGIESRMAGVAAILEINEAVEEIRAAGNGATFFPKKRLWME